MAGSEISMTAEGLDRMQRVTRARERVRIAALIDQLAAAEITDTHATARLYAFAEELRTEGLPVKLPSAEQVAQANQLEAERVDAEVRQQEAEMGDALPEVLHLDDDTEGSALVRNMTARRALGIGAPGMGIRD